MRILFISSSSGSRGGGELYLLFLAETLKHQGVEVGLWCSTHYRMNELADSFSKFGKVFRSEYKNTYDYKIRSLVHLFPKTIKGLQKACHDFKPDVIHLNKQNIEDGLDLLQTLDKLKMPYVTTLHITQTQRSLGALLGGLRDMVSRKMLQRSKSKKWITISPARYQDLASFMGVERDIVMIPNGVKIERDEGGVIKKAIRAQLNIPENHLVAISVGRLESQKNPMKFIDWAKQCLTDNNQMKFFWIGDGSMRNEFEIKVNSFHLGDKIVCLGWQKDVTPFYAMADIYLHPADYEGLPFSLLEAMSWRLPSVVSEELHGDLSFPKEVLLMDVEGLKSLMNDTNSIEQSGKRAQEYVIENFSLDVISKSYLSLYENVLS